MKAVPVPGFPSYVISEFGDVRRIGSAKPLRVARLKRGRYLAVSLWENGRGYTRTIHVLVALAFHGPRPDGKQAAHNDGNKENCHASNISWKTRVENEADKIRHGTSNRGERNGQAKITDEQVKLVMARIREGRTQSAVAAELGISQGHVSNIVRGRRRSATA